MASGGLGDPFPQGVLNRPLRTPYRQSPAGQAGIRSHGLIRRASAGQTAQSFTQRRPPARSVQARQMVSRAAWAWLEGDGVAAVLPEGGGGEAGGDPEAHGQGQSARSARGTWTAGLEGV